MEQSSGPSGDPRAVVASQPKESDTPDGTKARLSVLWLGAASLVVAGNLLLHLPLTDLSDWFVERLGFVPYNSFLGWSFLLLGVGALIGVSFAGTGVQPVVRLSMVGLVALAGLADRLLLVTNIEHIHYPQYALLVALLARAGLSLEGSWLAATILGVGDEAYQYLVLRRGTPTYLDWNDIVFNAIGAAFGVVLWCRYLAEQRTSPLCSRRTMTIVVVAAVAAGSAIAPPHFVPFFEELPFGGPRFHILTASEGVLIVSGLWMGIRTFLRRVR
jgi:hypothetical protein